MKKILILAGALVALTAGVAAASDGVVNLAWGDCGTFGTASRTFACNSNAGAPGILVGSYTSFVNLDSLNGNEIVIELQTTSVGQVSPWWQVKNYTDATPGCRNGAASISFDFTAGPFNCFDYWSGQALGGFGIIREPATPNRQRVLGVCAVGLSQAGPLASNTETYSFKLTINNTKTVGAGACAGCTDGALIVLNSILCTQNPGVASAVIGDGVLAGPADHSMETLGTFAQMNGGVPGAPGPTPTKNTSWGAVKSLYR
jgi:hypothetical protein